jgi:ADP-ribose pyrophosphatase YjhB (NUDIX family)
VVVVPGGHVESGESLEEACKRELKEELGLEC